MSRIKEPVTQAIRVLRKAGVVFTGHPYDYEPGGGTAQFARLMQVDEHRVIKTLIMEDEHAQPMVVLMHGDREVSTKELARQLGVKAIRPCQPAVADRHSGYKIGGTSPFGTRLTMPVYCQASIAELPDIYINGGSRGYIISLRTSDLFAVLQPRLLDIAQEPS